MNNGFSEETSAFANALFLIAKEKNEIEMTKNLVASLEMILKSYPKIITILNSGTIKNQVKDEIINTLCSKKNSIYLKNTFLILISKKRVYMILKIFEQLQKIINNHLGIVEGIIYTASKLTKKAINLFEQKLTKKYKKNIKLKNKIDKELVYGFKILLNDKVIEYSMLSELETIKKMLITKGRV